MNTQKFYFSILFFSMSYSFFCQTTRELGAGVNGIESYNLIYKKQLEESRYISHMFGSGAFSFVQDSTSKHRSAGFNYTIGFEKRKSITEKLVFAHGFSPSLKAQYTRNVNSFGGQDLKRDQLCLSPSLGYILAFQYHISDKFYFGFQARPSILTNLNFDDNGFVQEFNIHGNISSNTGLQIVYKF